ncbi:kinesin-like protein KIF15 isoform X1 [Corythoichthys intestinalis]|uniref:kinesin-like protein KIF15 isoform X1 n=1 Tax=Corythoichthys intestinalis TaxID=161448 RepID=UPI0025A5AC21|nr:kinesin-like protein KIF15-A isoform X1 [Corythoichthys intestinalis]
MNLVGKGGVDTQQLSGSSDSDSIKVFVRVRPLTHGTGLTTDGERNLCLKVTSPNTIRLLSKPEPRTFTYDHVADMDTTQDSVFSSVGKNIVESCINGYNGTIFAYGQTGSGKTFTMLGPSDSDNFTDEMRGVIPRSFEYLFFLINREVSQSKSFLCKCSFIEIYNEQIFDLLDTASASLFVRENIKKGVFVEGAVEKFVNNAAEAYQVLSRGWCNRRVASTSMNRESSRSHAVFTMTLESKESINEVVNIRRSQLNLVDLAGSERQKDTHTDGSRLKEASSINRSLMSLGQVIMALVDVSNGRNRHICYRDSKLTFLLRDSLGGNAQTYIIANVHPGSKCFGETLSTLQFAQRAKLIKNKAVVNEDTQGNVRQLQAEVKKLKEQLAQALSSHQVDDGKDVTAGGTELPISKSSGDMKNIALYKAKFMAAVRLWRKREEEKRVLLKKASQLEEAWTQKDKFIHSSRLIIKFREDHISRLEKKLKEQCGVLGDMESQALIEQLKEEISILRDQVEHNPKMTRYAAENYSLREENRQLRSLESVIKAEEEAVQVAQELEDDFQRAMEAETTETPANASTSLATDVFTVSAMEKLKAQLLQKQSDFTAILQAFEEYKEVTKKQMSQLESDKRYLDKSNRYLENILEATNAYKKQEVSELNRIHVETLKSSVLKYQILTTPTKAYLRSRPIPLSSPEHLNGSVNNPVDIWAEPPPSDTTEMALTEELRQVQVQASQIRAQLGEEELKNSRLMQQIAKLEEQIHVISHESALKEEQLSMECANKTRDHLRLQETIDSLQQKHQRELETGEVLRNEIRDLRLVLRSSDKELAAVKEELKAKKSEQQRETSQLSSSLIATQLQLDKVQLDWEQLLEQHRALQDSFDQLQAEAKFDADHARQQMQDRQQEISELQAQIVELNNSLETAQEHTSTLTYQLIENKENTSKELSVTNEENTQLNKQVVDMTVQFQQQVSKLDHLEKNLCTANESIKGLKQKIEQDKVVVLDLITQTRELRSDLTHKEQTIAHLSGDITDITAKYNAACLEQKDVGEQNAKMLAEIAELKESVERTIISSKNEVEALQYQLADANEEVERLTKVLDEHNNILQSAQEQATQKDFEIQNLQQKVQRQQEAAERTIPTTPCTPGSFSRDLTQVLENQERELENRRSSMMTMEILLAELNSERAAKNEEIRRLKTQLNEKEVANMVIQGLHEPYNKIPHSGNANSEELHHSISQSVLKELQEEREEKDKLIQKLSDVQKKLQIQESTLAQSQACVQELSAELGNRCLELSQRLQDEDKLLKENEVLRRQNVQLSEENGKLVGHKNHKQKIEYLVKLKKDNTRLQEENEKLRSEMSLIQDNTGPLP